MAEDIMGKSFCNYKPYLIIIIFLFALLSPTVKTHAGSNEFELFDRAYEYYLSYQPEKAVEEFTLFLKEFPDSSARDAALFWLGKAFIQIQLPEEAEKVFSEIKEKHPQSPFILFVKRESDDFEKIENDETMLSLKEKEDLAKKIASERDELKKKLKEKEKESEDLHDKISQLEETEDSLNKLFEEEKRKTEELTNALNKCEEKKNEIVQQTDALTENVTEKEIIGLLLEEKKKKAESLQAKLKEYEYKESYIKNSSAVLQTLGIKDIVWRTGNVYEDMDNEQILYEKAKSLNVVPDIEQYRDFIKKYTFNQIQSDYLERFLILSGLIDLRLKEMPEEKMVEILMVKFGNNKFDKTALAANLQKHARKGLSFYDIYRLYPEEVQYSETGFKALQDWIKKRIQPLQNGQTGVIWSEDGYIIIKKAMKKLSYEPFQTISPEIKEKIRNYVRQWIDEYRNQTK
jgi:TolA-binding protein